MGESLPQAISKALRLLDRDPKDDLVCEFVLDTYPHSFSYISTRALVSELSESAVLDALGKGRCYICYEALGDPQGFRFQALGKGQKALMGGSLPHQHGLELEIASPIPCVLRLLKDGKTVGKTEGRGLIHRVEGPGVYRAEAWLRLLDTERLWLFTNPIYVTG